MIDVYEFCRHFCRHGVYLGDANPVRPCIECAEGGEDMADVNATTLAAIIADYLENRDDIGRVAVKPSDDESVAVLDVESQGGRQLLVTIVRLAERAGTVETGG